MKRTLLCLLAIPFLAASSCATTHDPLRRAEAPPLPNGERVQVWMSGRELLELCREDPARCRAFIAAADDTLLIGTGGRRPWCGKPTETLNGLRAAFMDWAEKHEDSLDYPAIACALTALTEAFPCDGAGSAMPDTRPDPKPI